jgi:hypothetical protein
MVTIRGAGGVIADELVKANLDDTVRAVSGSRIAFLVVGPASSARPGTLTG